MAFLDKWTIPLSEKKQYIKEILPELTTLRTKAGISQDDLSNVIGVSRQTYGSIERGTQRLTWNTYLSLIYFYDSNKSTRDMLRGITDFPKRFYDILNDSSSEVSMNSVFGDDADDVFSALDDAAFRAIKTVVMLEYARCTSTPGEEVVKSFDGFSLKYTPSDKDAEVEKAIKRIKKKRKNG